MKLLRSACGFDSSHAAKEKNLFSVFDKRSAALIAKHCDAVMLSNTVNIYEEHVMRQDGLLQKCLSVKLPLYNPTGIMIGVFGCTIVEGRQSLADSLMLIAKLGFLNFHHQSHAPKHKILTTRQKECLYYLSKGLTAKKSQKNYHYQIERLNIISMKLRKS